ELVLFLGNVALLPDLSLSGAVMFSGLRRPSVLRLFLLSVAVLFLAHLSPAQQPAAKRPLSHNDYDSWRSISGQQLSPDGKYLAYSLTPQEGDAEVVARNLTTGMEWRYAKGGRSGLGELPESVGPRFGGRGIFLGRGMAFTPDGQTLVFQITPTKAESDKAKKSKKSEDLPRNSLGLLDLNTGKVLRIERVR